MYGGNLSMICSPPIADWIPMKTIIATLNTNIFLIGLVTEADINCNLGFNIMLNFSNSPTWGEYKSNFSTPY